MNHYINLCPPQCEDIENLNIDIPSHYMDEILILARDLADERNINLRKAVGELFRESYKTLMEKSYERKNRKTAKR
jgi:hypothetical protein